MTSLATTPTPDVEEDPLLLYQPIKQQINPKKIPWTIEYPKLTPKQAAQMLEEADTYEEFGQRPRTPARIKRWLTLMETNRFVEYLPVGALCTNEDGILMNGGNRMAALAQYDKPVGFMVIRNCPSWLLSYFDNGNMRTQREAILISKKKLSPETTAVVRLAMRYEEFIFGKRKAIGWAEWGRHHDEHVDATNFMDRREYLFDLIPDGKRLKKRIDIQPASATCFIGYQQLAWPEGVDKLEEFVDSLDYGANLRKGHPALTLREWTQRDGFIGGTRAGRREGHLLLLFKFFTLWCEGHTVNDVKAARGLPMAMPYHPDGWDVACKNVREALVEMD